MSRILFKQNKNGTFDILDSETPQAIYNISRFELEDLYRALKVRYDTDKQFDMIRYANDLLSNRRKEEL